MVAEVADLQDAYVDSSDEDIMVEDDLYPDEDEDDVEEESDEECTRHHHGAGMFRCFDHRTIFSII